MRKQKEQYSIEKDDLIFLNSILRKVNRGRKKYEKELLEFEDFLSKYPMLGFNHKTGRSLFKNICKEDWSLLTPISDEFYRASKLRDSRFLSRSHFKMPELGMTNFGRYNIQGQKAYYLSTTKEGACEEVIYPIKKTPIWVSKISIQGSLRIADIRLDPLNYSFNDNILHIALCDIELLRKKTEYKNKNFKPEYFLTNFIADCFRFNGYDGIAYTSAKYYCDNLVVFENTKPVNFQIGKPELILYEPDKLNKHLQKIYNNKKATKA
jgi:hypothetical protein